MSLRTAAALIPAVWFIAGCATLPPSQPVSAFRVDEAEFRAQIKSLCVDELRGRAGLPNEDERLARVSKILISELKALNFEVVSSERRKGVRERELAPEDTFYHANRGTLDLAEFQSFETRLLDRLGCDALVKPTLALVTAPFQSGRAEWDGAIKDIGGSEYLGTVTAVSIWIAIEDREGRELYFRSGGIQLLGKLDIKFLSAGLQPIEEELILANEEDCRMGIHLALEGLPPAARLPENSVESEDFVDRVGVPTN